MADLIRSMAALRAEREETARQSPTGSTEGGILGGAMVPLAITFLPTLPGTATGLFVDGRGQKAFQDGGVAARYDLWRRVAAKPAGLA